MGNNTHKPLDKIFELGMEDREQKSMIPVVKGIALVVAGLVFGPPALIGGLLFFDHYLEKPARVRECIESVESRHFPTDLCEDRCFGINYLRFRNDYLKIQSECKNLGLLQTDKIDYLGLAYERARDLCKSE